MARTWEQSTAAASVAACRSSFLSVPLALRSYAKLFKVEISRAFCVSWYTHDSFVEGVRSFDRSKDCDSSFFLLIVLLNG